MSNFSVHNKEVSTPQIAQQHAPSQTNKEVGCVDGRRVSQSTDNRILKQQTNIALTVVQDMVVAGGIGYHYGGFVGALGGGVIGVAVRAIDTENWKLWLSAEKLPGECGLLTGLTTYHVSSTKPGTVEGFWPGESRHKTVIRHVFAQLTQQSTNKKSETSEDWLSRQSSVEAPKQITKDPKIANDIFVAHIMSDPAIMKKAANFALVMATKYASDGERSSVLKGKTPEMDHIWPNQNLEGNKNSEYRGWGSVAWSLGSHYLGRSAPDLSKALGENIKDAQKLD